jgi:hypothetical protein
MPETPVTHLAQRVPRPRVRLSSREERRASRPPLPHESTGPEQGLPLRLGIPSLEYWLDVSA